MSSIGIKELVKVLCEGKTNLHPDVEVISIAEERKGSNNISREENVYTLYSSYIISCEELLYLIAFSSLCDCL